MSTMNRCAACGKEKPVGEMEICMHAQMHRYVCDSKCMHDFYNPPKAPADRDRIAALEAERERLRVKLMAIASAEPARHCIEWAKSHAAEGNNEVYAKWREAIDEAHALAAENARLRNSMLRLVTTHCAAAAKNNATDAELEQYLSAGIAQLEAECERLRAQVSALQSDANSWQSGYDKGREDGAKAADGWKVQHARDSAELRRLCAERDHLKACQENAHLHITGLVAERNAALMQRDKLAGLLRKVLVTHDYHTDDGEEAADAARAALSELTP